MAEKNKGGRPRKLDEKKIETLKVLMREYIEQETYPIISEFVVKYGQRFDMTRQGFYDYKEFSTLMGIMTSKRECNLFKHGLHKKVDVNMAKFGLAQLGWSDKQDINQHNTGNIDNNITIKFVE